MSTMSPVAALTAALLSHPPLGWRPGRVTVRRVGGRLLSFDVAFDVDAGPRAGLRSCVTGSVPRVDGLWAGRVANGCAATGKLLEEVVTVFPHVVLGEWMDMFFGVSPPRLAWLTTLVAARRGTEGDRTPSVRFDVATQELVLRCADTTRVLPGPLHLLTPEQGAVYAWDGTRGKLADLAPSVASRTGPARAAGPDTVDLADLIAWDPADVAAVAELVRRDPLLTSVAGPGAADVRFALALSRDPRMPDPFRSVLEVLCRRGHAVASLAQLEATAAAIVAPVGG